MKTLDLSIGRIHVRLHKAETRSAACEQPSCSFEKTIHIAWGAQEDSVGGETQHLILALSVVEPGPPNLPCSWLPFGPGLSKEGLSHCLDFIARLISAHPRGTAALSVVGEPLTSSLLCDELSKRVLKLVHDSAAVPLERIVLVTVYEMELHDALARALAVGRRRWEVGSSKTPPPQKLYKSLSSFYRAWR